VRGRALGGFHGGGLSRLRILDRRRAPQLNWRVPYGISAALGPRSIAAHRGRSRRCEVPLSHREHRYGMPSHDIAVAGKFAFGSGFHTVALQLIFLRAGTHPRTPVTNARRPCHLPRLRDLAGPVGVGCLVRVPPRCHRRRRCVPAFSIGPAAFLPCGWQCTAVIPVNGPRIPPGAELQLGLGRCQDVIAVGSFSNRDTKRSPTTQAHTAISCGSAGVTTTVLVAFISTNCFASGCGPLRRLGHYFAPPATRINSEPLTLIR